MRSKKCNNPVCEKHGLKLKSGGTYCPACGHRTILVPVFPFALYVPIEAIWIVTGAAFLVLMSIYVIAPAISNVLAASDEAKAKRQAIAQTMPGEWAALYAAVAAVRDQDKVDLIADRAKATKNFADWPKLTGEQLQAILEEIPSSGGWSDQRTKAANVLVNCVKDK
jgi:hypothetical protein